MMKIKHLALLAAVSGGGAACADGESSKAQASSGGASPIEDSGCWWCVDGSYEGGPTDSGTKGDSSTKGDAIYLEGKIDTKTWTGTYTYRASDGAKQPICHIEYEILKGAPTTPCPTCDIAVSFEVGKVVSSDRELKCEKGKELAGKSYTYGRDKGSSVKGVNTLWILESGTWNKAGFSTPDKSNPDLWSFLHLLSAVKK